LSTDINTHGIYVGPNGGKVMGCLIRWIGKRTSTIRNLSVAQQYKLLSNNCTHQKFIFH
jgi:hypothetical protein